MPRRIRPKKYNLDKSGYSKLRTKWRKWLPDLATNLSEIIAKKEIFWELQEIAKENKNILKQPNFFEWMCQNYIDSVSIGIRKFTDHDRRSRSLWVMIFQILECPGIISRKSHVSHYTEKVHKEFDMGNITFDNVVGKNKPCLTQTQIKSDLKQLEDANERIKRFVNKRIAHFNTSGSIRRLPTFKELDNALDVIDKLFCKYNLLLTASGEESMHAERQVNWTEVLWDAWVKPGSKFYPDTYLPSI